MNKTKKIYILLIFLAGFIFGIGLLAINKAFLSSNIVYAGTYGTNSIENALNPEENSYFKYYRMFYESYTIIRNEFYDQKMVDTKNLMYGAMKGMLESLNDPYTVFMDPASAKEFNIDVTGTFSGLGLQIDMKDGELTVVSPIEDTPAWKAGIKSGDKIIEIEGVSTKGITIKDAVAKMRGNIGTKVTITLEREGVSEPFKVTMIREEIKLKTVKFDTINFNKKKYTYIKVTEFTEPTAEEFEKKLKEVISNKPAGLIIDLRNNPGGLLNVVANCANFFLSEGIIVYTRGRLHDNDEEFTARKEESFVPLDLPLVVLINQGSASASEIFAGAMQDTGRGVLVGMKSFGKGSVQKTYNFPEDGSTIKYTVARYYTPSGICIDKIGLTPNVEQKLWFESLPDEEKTAIVKIQDTNLLRDFIAKNPSYTDAELKEFRKELQNKGFKLGDMSLKYLLTMKKMENSILPVYDLEFDNQLVKALSVLTDYGKYKKPFKVYMEAK
jgi:carboxyl-terminal processing protease